jgi:hypothetical protein
MITLFLTKKKFAQLKKTGRTHVRQQVDYRLMIKRNPIECKIAKLKAKLKLLESKNASKR